MNEVVLDGVIVALTVACVWRGLVAWCDWRALRSLRRDREAHDATSS